jgi:ketosteroid isomerase-like protein
MTDPPAPLEGGNRSEQSELTHTRREGTATRMNTVTERPTTPLAALFERFFETKAACDVDGTMAFFSPDLATYTDATLGWNLESFEALRDVFVQYMPGWNPPARSYTTGIHSNDVSALLHMVDTPELFGTELRILAAVDFCDGKIIRWVDYWDAGASPDELYANLRTPDAQFPRDLKDSQVATQAAPELVAVARALHDAFASGDASAAAELLHTDVVFSDQSLRTQHIGRIETTRYLERVLPNAPYGQSSSLRHVVGGDSGGGFEWTAGPQHAGLVGITAIELDNDGLVTTVTSVYDSRQISPPRRATLADAALPR